MNTLRLFLPVLMTTLLLTSTSPASADDQQKDCPEENRLTTELRQQAGESLSQLAENLSVLVSQAETRKQLVSQLAESKSYSLSLSRMLAAHGQSADTKQSGDGQRGDQLATAADLVSRIESVMEKCGADVPRLDLKLPVAAHREMLKDAQEIYVAVAPLAEEHEVTSITAWANGKRMELDSREPPKVPTLVIVGAEPQADDPGYPLPTAEKPGDEENPRQVDDYVGIPWIYLYDDNESWACGDPEIYVRVKRFRFSTFSILNSKIDLPGVNGEQVWYNLGDWNSTYKFVNTADYAPVVRLEFWEEDSGFHGGDDFLGATLVTWTGLSFSGYSYRNVGDVRIGIDRD